jgi:hypothetical protein
MDLDAAISLLGTGEPWHVVPKSEFAGYRSSGRAHDYPWFAMNRQETIQFRIIGERIDAIFLRPEELTGYDQLRETLPEKGFVREDEQRIPGEDAFIQDGVRVSIPTSKERSPGFGCAVTIELARSLAEGGGA